MQLEVVCTYLVEMRTAALAHVLTPKTASMPARTKRRVALILMPVQIAIAGNVQKYVKNQPVNLFLLAIGFLGQVFLHIEIMILDLNWCVLITVNQTQNELQQIGEKV